MTDSPVRLSGAETLLYENLRMTDAALGGDSEEVDERFCLGVPEALVG